MKEKIDALVAQLIALGMTKARARALVQKIIDAPPTDDEIAEALRENQ